MKHITCLLLALALVGCEDKKTPAPAPSATATAHASAHASGSAEPEPAVQKGTGNKDVKETVAQLPAVDESFYAAKQLGLLDAWQKTAPFKPRKLDGLKPGETALEVGRVLVDIAVLTADPKKPITPDVVQHVVTAMKALHAPAAVLQSVDALVAEVKKGGKDDELRLKLGKILVETLPSVEEDPKLASTAGLAMAGGYLRSMAVTSKVLSTAAASDQDKLDLLHRQMENGFFIELIVKKLDAGIQGEPAVRDALDALQKIKAHVEKQKPTPEDAKAIAAATTKYAS